MESPHKTWKPNMCVCVCVCVCVWVCVSGATAGLDASRSDQGVANRISSIFNSSVWRVSSLQTEANDCWTPSKLLINPAIASASGLNPCDPSLSRLMHNTHKWVKWYTLSFRVDIKQIYVLSQYVINILNLNVLLRFFSIGKHYNQAFKLCLFYKSTPFCWIINSPALTHKSDLVNCY